MDEVTRRLTSSFEQINQDSTQDLQNVGAKQNLLSEASNAVSPGIAATNDSIAAWTPDPFADMVAAYQTMESAEPIATLFEESKAEISSYLQGLTGSDELGDLFSTMFEYLKMMQKEAREDASIVKSSGELSLSIPSDGAVAELKEHAEKIFDELLQQSNDEEAIKLDERYKYLISWLDDNK